MEYYISLEDAKLYVDIITNGTELYTSQDGCYAEYELDDDIYVLDITDNFVTIGMKDDSVEPDDTELPF